MSSCNAILQRIGENNEYKCIPLVQNQVIIGRDAKATFRIDSVRISRRHALFKYEEGLWTVTDLQSVNGICLNSKPLKPRDPTILRNGDIIRFGPQSLKVDFEYVFTNKNPVLESPTKAVVSKLEKENKLLNERLANLQNAFKHKEKEMQAKIEEKVALMEEETKNIQTTLKTEFEEELMLKEKNLRQILIDQREKIINESQKIEDKLLNKDFKNMQESKRKNLKRKMNYYRKALSDKELTQELFEEELLELKKSGDKISPEALSVRSKVLEEFSSLIDTELECAICTELFINALTLNCSHSFCEFCLNQWKENGHNSCPNCMAEIKTEAKSVVLDSFISRVTNRLPVEKRKYREQIIQERLKTKDKPDDQMESTSRAEPRTLRRYCHCGVGSNHLKTNCPSRIVRRSKRSRF